MANKFYEETDIAAIASAIRTKLGVQTTYKVSEMANAVSSIPAGQTPLYIKNPIEFDYTNGYVDTNGKWYYQYPSNNYSDIYAVENGKTYRLLFGATAGNRARGCLTTTDVRTLPSGSEVQGTYVGASSPTAGTCLSFISSVDGYLILQKSNNSQSGILTYLYCVDDMNSASPSGTKNITANGDGIDVASYAQVNVHVPGTTPPSGKITILENGTDIDVSQYAYADVNVQGGGGQLPSNMEMKTIQVSENSHDIVIPYDSQRTPLIVLGAPVVLSGTRYECSSFFLKRNFITNVFNEISATYFNSNVSDDILNIGGNAGTIALDETNHTITMTTKSTTYWFYATDIFNVFIVYSNS